MLDFLWPAVPGLPDPHRDPRLPRPARAGPRRHLRGPGARPGGRARHHASPSWPVIPSRATRPTGTRWPSRWAGPLLFAVSRVHRAPIPRRRSSASSTRSRRRLAVLVVDRAPQGGEHIKQLLVGSILTVTGGEVASLAVLYARDRRAALARAPAAARDLARRRTPRGPTAVAALVGSRSSTSSFAIVVTSSVRMAGVLLVFSYLDRPGRGRGLAGPRCRARLADRLERRRAGERGGPLRVVSRGTCRRAPRSSTAFGALLALAASRWRVRAARRRRVRRARASARSGRRRARRGRRSRSPACCWRCCPAWITSGSTPLEAAVPASAWPSSRRASAAYGGQPRGARARRRRARRDCARSSRTCSGARVRSTRPSGSGSPSSSPGARDRRGRPDGAAHAPRPRAPASALLARVPDDRARPRLRRRARAAAQRREDYGSVVLARSTTEENCC